MPERHKPEPAYDSANWQDAEPENNGEDPLAELARLVQGIGNPSPGPIPVRPAPPRYESITRAQPAARYAAAAERLPAEPVKPADRPIGEADLASDLEAELMRDLQASFAAVRAPIESPRYVSDIAPLISYELEFDAFADMHLRQSSPVDAPRPPAKAGIESLATWRESQGRAKPGGPGPTLKPRLSDSAGAVASATSAPERLGLRPAARDHLAADPEIAAAAAAAESFGQIPAGRDQRTPSFESIGPAVGDEYPAVPGYGPAEHIEEIDRHRDEQRQGGKRGLVLVGSLLGVVLLGTLAFFGIKGLSGGETDEVPVITADAGPTKIAPANPGGATATEQNKLIYDRVGGAGDASDAALAPDESVTTVPRPEVQRTDASREISRIILPNSGDPLLPDEGKASESAGAEEAPAVGPKRVRTVVVRPDGTIVSSTSAPAPATAPSDSAEATSADRPAATVSLADTTTAPSSDAAPGSTEVPVHETVAAPEPEPAPLTLEEDWASEDALASDEAPTAAAEPPVRHAEPATTATPPRSTGPISLLPKSGAADKPAARVVASAEPTAPAPRASTASGSYFVQVSSQRSESAATAAYRELQRRFPSVLGDREPDIQRADLGSRGIYYRARVAPGLSSEAAGRLCTSLKNAGGDCIVTQN